MENAMLNLIKNKNRLLLIILVALIQASSAVFSAEFIIKATATGILNNGTLSINVQPDQSMVGQPGSLFIAAKLPSGAWSYPTSTGWQQWDPSMPLPPYLTTTLQATNNFTLIQNMSVTQFGGATIYAGYGSSMAAMMSNGTYNPVYTVPGISSSAYGQLYSNSILRGVTLNDVFIYNDTNTTPYGPAYANIVSSSSSMLACMPPTGRKISYALCYYSGPNGPTGNNPDNPSLPCTLSPDGVVANCTCYAITSDAVSPKVPYYVDINAISNLYIYQETVEACGTAGEKCAASDIQPPVCDAINTNMLVPGADLVSVFSPVYIRDYTAQGGGDSTSCTGQNAGLYAGCMTAPCYRTGQKDASGREIVQCKCPVYNGPYQVGQANQSCNANQPANSGSQPSSAGNNNVWSAAYNPSGGSVTPPAGACIPDIPGSKGCGLYDPAKDYKKIIDPAGALCKNVCAAYGTSNVNNPASQVGYTCDSTLCTTLGIGQGSNPSFPPPRRDQAALSGAACTGIQNINGMKQIMMVEALAECSCCASQVCSCDTVNQPTNQAIFDLDQQQRNVGIQPQCDINGTLCGTKK